MSVSMDKLAKELKAQITASDERKPKPYDAQAEVLRVEDDIAWVHIPGGVQETPVRLTLNAKKGDIVNIHVANGSAWITGNGTNPPTDDTLANIAKGIATTADDKSEKAMSDANMAHIAANSAEAEALRAKTEAEKASLYAGDAQTYAASAQTYAIEANEFAENAKKSVDNIDQSIYGTITYKYDNDGIEEIVYKRDDGIYYWMDSNDEEHVISEDDLVRVDGEIVTDRKNDGLETLVTEVEVLSRTAESSAISANNSANSALVQLSEVEKVVDVLTWVSEHGRYTLTDDEIVEVGKYYFDGTFHITEDTSINTNKTYYVNNNDVFEIVMEPDIEEISNYYEGIFEVIKEPTGNPETHGWYELSSVNEAVSNYISSHLSLTDSGLFVQMDDNNYKMQIASDGIYLWNGTKKIATYSGTVTLGDENDMHIVLSPSELGFYTAGTGIESRVAYINTEMLSITSAEITSELRIGNFIWKPRSGRLTLMYSPVS